MGISAIVGAVVGLSTVKQQREQKKAANEQRRQNEIAQRREGIRAQRERVMALRQMRIQQSRALQAGVNSGIVSQSSGAQSTGFAGANASYQSQFAANTNFAERMDQLQQQNINSINRQIGYTTRAGGYGAIADLGMKAFPYAQQFDQR